LFTSFFGKMDEETPKRWLLGSLSENLINSVTPTKADVLRTVFFGPDSQRQSMSSKIVDSIIQERDKLHLLTKPRRLVVRKLNQLVATYRSHLKNRSSALESVTRSRETFAFNLDDPFDVTPCGIDNILDKTKNKDGRKRSGHEELADCLDSEHSKTGSSISDRKRRRTGKPTDQVLTRCDDSPTSPIHPGHEDVADQLDTTRSEGLASCQKRRNNNRPTDQVRAQSNDLICVRKRRRSGKPTDQGPTRCDDLTSSPIRRGHEKLADHLDGAHSRSVVPTDLTQKNNFY
jgi:hypothetical protein